MADAEESPSSLADLEALAGLAEEPSQAGDDFANDADAGDFDLASLARSAGVGARDAESVAGDDHQLDAQRDVPVQSPASSASPSATPGTVRGPWGFVLGVIAGVAAAGVLFLALRDTAPPEQLPNAATVPTTAVTTSSAQPSSTLPSAALPSSTQPSSARASAPVVETAKAEAPVPDAHASDAPTSDAAKVARSGSARASVSAPASSASSNQAAADEDPNADPTRPPSPTPRVEPTEPSAPSRPIDSLLDDALGSGKPAKRASSDALMGAELPLTPTAADVTKVVQVLLPAIRGCAMGQSGVANTLLVVRNDGGVASASVTGAPYAGAASGRCMEGVLRRAKFARFQQTVFRVQFPLSIRANAP